MLKKKQVVWKKIKDYEQNYWISSDGIVKNNHGHVLSPHIDKDGYLRIDLYKNNKRKKFGIHRLVALTFLNKPFPSAVVNHKDENKQNNRVGNLEWLSSKENTNYGFGMRRRSISQGKRVAQFDISGKLIAVFSSTADAGRQTGIHRSHISMAATGKVKTARSFRWKYV